MAEEIKADATPDTNEAALVESEQEGEPLPPPVQVNLDAPADQATTEGAAEEKVDASKTTGRRSKNRRPASDRIAELADANQRMANEVEQGRQAHAQESLRREEAQVLAITTAMENLDLKSERLQQRLKAAIDESDVDAQTKIQTDMAGLAAEKSRLQPYMPTRGDGERAQPDAPRQAAPPARTEPNFPPETRSWLANNPWMEQKNKDDYDHEMFTEARTYAQVIENRFRRAGRGAEIGRSPDYFKAIDDHMRAEFPDAFEEDAPAPKAANTAPPLNRSGGNGATIVRGPTHGASASDSTLTLTGEQRSMARAMAYKYNPNLQMGKHPLAKIAAERRGQPMLAEHAEIHHAWLVREDNRKRAQQKAS